MENSSYDIFNEVMKYVRVTCMMLIHVKITRPTIQASLSMVIGEDW